MTTKTNKLIDEALKAVDAALAAKGWPLERERQDDHPDCEHCQDKGCRRCREEDEPESDNDRAERMSLRAEDTLD